MAIITLAQVKEFLGISDSSYDTQITAKIPYIDAKVKQITRHNWNDLVYGNTTVDNPYVLIYPAYDIELGYKPYQFNERIKDVLEDLVFAGQQVSGTGIASGAYVDSIYPNGVPGSLTFEPAIKLSSNCTATGTTVEIYLGFPIGYLDIVAKGVWFLIGGTSTALPKNSITGRSMGPLSVQYSASDNKLDGQSGMPLWFVKGLPRFIGGK